MYYYSTIRLVLIYRPSEDGRSWVDLGTAVSVQPVPKAAYRSDFRENTNFLSAARFETGPSRAAGKRVRPLDHCDLNEND